MLDKCPDPLVGALGRLQVLNDLRAPSAKPVADVLNLVSECLSPQAESHRLPRISDLILGEPQLLFKQVNTEPQPTVCLGEVIEVSDERPCLGNLRLELRDGFVQSCRESRVVEHCLIGSPLLLLQGERNRLDLIQYLLGFPGLSS